MPQLGPPAEVTGVLEWCQVPLEAGESQSDHGTSMAVCRGQAAQATRCRVCLHRHQLRLQRRPVEQPAPCTA